MARQTEQQKKDRMNRNRDALLASIHVTKNKDGMWYGEKRNDGDDNVYIHGKPTTDRRHKGAYTKNPIENPSLLERITRRRPIPPFRNLSDLGGHIRNKNREKLRGW